MGIDDPPRYGRAEASPLGLGGVERFEDPRFLLCREPRTVVTEGSVDSWAPRYLSSRPYRRQFLRGPNMRGVSSRGHCETPCSEHIGRRRIVGPTRFSAVEAELLHFFGAQSIRSTFSPEALPNHRPDA